MSDLRCWTERILVPTHDKLIKSKQLTYIMKYDNRTVAGALLFVGSVQFLFGLIIAEILYPGYNVSKNFISDLGVGPTSLIFNSSVFLLGVFIVATAYFIHRSFGSRLLSFLFTLTGLGAMGVGLFPETVRIIHPIFALIAFGFGGLSAIMSYKLQKLPFTYFSVLLGAISLIAIALYGSGTFLGLDKGGMERMIAYPTLIWALGFGGYLIGYSEE
ncbi:MAG: DUF998 domain-containing protein [Candidatus Methylarchaceae archaeon HK02M2]|nr:DUF998 domain-containing protein [Candidatus Methylarchaceae archaeon HK02M2]